MGVEEKQIIVLARNVDREDVQKVLSLLSKTPITNILGYPKRLYHSQISSLSITLNYLNISIIQTITFVPSSSNKRGCTVIASVDNAEIRKSIITGQS